MKDVGVDPNRKRKKKKRARRAGIPQRVVIGSGQTARLDFCTSPIDTSHVLGGVMCTPLPVSV